MKQEKGRGQEMAWASVRLIVLSCVLTGVLIWVRPGMFGLPGWLYWCVTGSLCMLVLAQVYCLSRDFFRGKK